MLQKGLELVVDSIDGKAIKDILAREIHLFDAHIKKGAEIFYAADYNVYTD